MRKCPDIRSEVTAYSPPIPVGDQPTLRRGSGPQANKGHCGWDARGATSRTGLCGEQPVVEVCAEGQHFRVGALQRPEASSPEGLDRWIVPWRLGEEIVGGLEQPEPGKQMSFPYSAFTMLISSGAATN